MSVNIDRTDRAVLSYLCKATVETDQKGIQLEKIHRDMDQIQKEWNQEFFNISQKNGELYSRRLREDIEHLEKSLQVEVNTKNGGTSVRPLGTGHMSARLSPPPQDFLNVIENVTNGDRPEPDSP